jgi:hypothetical protein
MPEDDRSPAATLLSLPEGTRAQSNRKSRRVTTARRHLVVAA